MSSSKQGLYSRIKIGPRLFRHIMNCWPPFWGVRVHIMRIAPDWREVTTRMKLSLCNKNYVGSHFGGGLFSMTDPFYMVMLVNILGSEYLVWDKAASIEFVAPGRSTVYAHFKITEAMIDEIKRATAEGEKFEPAYPVDIVDGEGKIIAKVRKTLYIRRKQPRPNIDTTERTTEISRESK
jgi:acyl-coenzyme A thioesterase PaaI-like protein